MNVKRISAIGAGVLGTAAAAVFFLDPRSGGRRRQAAVRTGEAVVRRSAAVVPFVGKGDARQAAEDGELEGAVSAALVAAVGDVADEFSVTVRRGVVTVRGEVQTLGEIAAVSRVLDSVSGATETVNLVRLRRSSPPPAAAGG